MTLYMKKYIIAAAAVLTAISVSAQDYVSNRPAPENRLFESQAVENEIVKVSGLLTNPKLAWMFANCFPNTLDTTTMNNYKFLSTSSFEQG